MADKEKKEKTLDVEGEESNFSIGTVTDIGIDADTIMEDARSTISRIVTGELKKSVSCSVLEGIMDHKGAYADLGIEDGTQEVGCCSFLRSRRQDQPRYQKFLEYLLAYIRHGVS